MYGRKTAKSLMTALLVGFTFLAVVSVAEAQSTGGAKDPNAFINDTQKTAAVGWKWLMMAASFVVGGGSLASGGRALFKGDWTTGGVGIGFGVVVLLLMWGLGNFFDYNDATTQAPFIPSYIASVVSC